MTLTLGFQTEARILVESTEGVIDDSASKKLELLSDSMVSVKLAPKTNRQVLFDIGSATGKGLIEGVQEYDLVLSWRWMDAALLYSTTTTGIIPDLINRQANGRSKTFSIEVAAAMDASTKSYHTFLGCKLDTIEFSLDADGVWIITATLKPLTWARATAAPTYTNITRPAIVVGSYFLFTGAVFESPAGTALAYATSKAGFTIKNNLTPVKNAGSTTVKTYAEGRQEVSGTFDVTVEDGGKALLDSVLTAGGSVADLVIKASTTSQKPKITLKNVFIDGLDMEFNDEDGVVTISPERMASAGITLGVV